MHVKQQVLTTLDNAPQLLAPLAGMQPNLVLVFGHRMFFSDQTFASLLADVFPAAIRIGCSTAGEISSQGVQEKTCVITAIRLEKGTLKSFAAPLNDMSDSGAAGDRLGEALKAPDLRAVMVFGPGVRINGSALAHGLATQVGNGIPITGGLAGDGTAFEKTQTLGAGGIKENQAVAVGFYGDAIMIGHGSYGGWDPFGPLRKITGSDGNMLYELDGEPALEVYKRYLGKHAEELPASGLLFPFSMQDGKSDPQGLIRTILGIDKATGSLTLAGEIDPDGYLKLMHSTTDKLVNAAEAAAEATSNMCAVGAESLAVLVSCVGRKLVMGDRVDEEVEAVSHVFGKGTTLAGFYSYGEICPMLPGGECRLHNQTMTITRIGER